MSEEEKTIENLRKNKGVSFAEADIILNLIEKQQKEIENFKWKENEQKNLLRYKTDRIEEQQKEIDKQNKVIDELIQELTDDEFDNPCAECYKECEKDNDTLFNCIKQYFIRKVEKDVQ